MAPDYESARPDSRWIFANALRWRAESSPDQVFLREIGGATAIDSDVDELARRIASGMRERGICFGDRVAIMLPNSIDNVACWAAAAYIGAIAVLMNNDYLGRILEHALRITDPSLVVVDPAFTDRLSEPRSSITPVVAARGQALNELGTEQIEPVCQRWSDTACLMFTSTHAKHRRPFPWPDASGRVPERVVRCHCW